MSQYAPRADFGPLFTPAPGSLHRQRAGYYDDPKTLGPALPAAPRFNGSDYTPALDDDRLAGQMRRVFALMRDGCWRTLAEIEAQTGDPAASVSAQLRHLRKARFGSHTVEKRARGERSHGLYEYRLIVAEARP